MSRSHDGLRRATGGFTLIELLTVISIISALIAILLPSLTGARQRGRITKCEANVRELASAVIRYASQHEDVFPVAADCGTSGCVFGNGHQYFGWNGRQLNPYQRAWARPVNRELGLDPAPPQSSAARIAECPADGGAPGQTGTPDTVFEALGSSYALNPILVQGRYADWKYRDKDLNRTEVLQDSRKVLVADHPAFGLTYDAHWTAARPGWHDQTRPSAVVGFADGHAEFVLNTGGLKEWQWYGEASGPEFIRRLTRKVDWTVLPASR
jgi:prepilin-type N-terminal cleavage/methylation domain-containing protein